MKKYVKPEIHVHEMEIDHCMCYASGYREDRHHPHHHEFEPEPHDPCNRDPWGPREYDRW